MSIFGILLCAVRVRGTVLLMLSLDYGRITVSAFQTEEGEDVQNKGTQLLEVYALEIQMYTEQKNNKV